MTRSGAAVDAKKTRPGKFALSAVDVAGGLAFLLVSLVILVRLNKGPHAMAICRNLIISLLRLAGHTSIARALRHHAHHIDQAIALVTSENPRTQ